MLAVAQGPFSAAQLHKLLKHGIFPNTCTVLIDLASLGSISVTVPASGLKTLLGEPDNLSTGQPHLHELAGLHEAPRAPKPVPQRAASDEAGGQENGERNNGRSRHKNGRGNGQQQQQQQRHARGEVWQDDSMPPASTGPPTWRRRLGADVAKTLSALLAMVLQELACHCTAVHSCSCHCQGPFLHLMKHKAKHKAQSLRIIPKFGLLVSCTRPHRSWLTSTGRTVLSRSLLLAATLPRSRAGEWLEEERAAEVYLYEDGTGFILGPFCINELQLQIEKCAAESLLRFRVLYSIGPCACEANDAFLQMCAHASTRTVCVWHDATCRPCMQADDNRPAGADV